MPKFNDTTIYGDLTVNGTIRGNYATGDILYASDANTLTTLPKGDNGQVLKLVDGLPAWGTDNNSNTVTLTWGSGTATTGTDKISFLSKESSSITAAKYTLLKAGSNVSFNTNVAGAVTISSSYDNTWNANSLNVAGYVSAPTASNKNKVWKTDANGNPDWRDDANNYLTGVSGSANGTATFTRQGLGDLTWTTSHTHDDRYYTEGETNTLLNAKLNTSLKGAVNGLAELGSDGKVLSGQLPSYVDDVLEYTKLTAFPANGESGKIYVALDTNKTYRWSGSGYTEISASLALGETSSTAGRGDWTKTAYDHTSLTNNPHSVTKAQVGLGNVDNTSDGTKYVQGLRETRANTNTQIWRGTKAQFDAIGTKNNDTLYFIL